MEKLYTIHLCDWLGKTIYITENLTGLGTYASGESYSRYTRAYRETKNLLEMYDIVYEVKDEPFPAPYFVSHYALSWGKKRFLYPVPDIVVTPVLTEQGVLRKAFEQGERLDEWRKMEEKRKNRRHIDMPFGRVYY